MRSHEPPGRRELARIADALSGIQAALERIADQPDREERETLEHLKRFDPDAAAAMEAMQQGELPD